MDNILKNARFSHAAIVVRDIDKTLDEYCRLFLLEKPLVKWTGKPEDAKVQYRDGQTPAMAKQAFLQFGDLRVEFMEPDENDSTWREYLEKRGEGFHHFAFDIDNMEETLESLGKEGIYPVQRGKYSTGQYAYVESEEKLNVMLELLENKK